MVKKLVHLLQGEISVSSERGVGSVFLVRLPERMTQADVESMAVAC